MKERLEVNPKPAWHELTDSCDNCHSKVWIEGVLVNSEGDFVFKVVCFKCGRMDNILLTAKHIASHCFDLDFLALAKIAN